MTKSAFVEVNITNPTKLAQDSQDTANTAVKGVTDLNDPNLMSVIEKQNNVVQFAGLTSQYNVIVQNAKDEGINTDSLITAYNNLNKFMIDVLTDPDHASDVDRKTYKNYQDTYNSELAKIQTALKNNTDGKFTSAASASSQAASVASQAFSAANGAFSQAQLVGSQADSAIAVQSQATTKAQSTADNAFSQAQVIGSQASADISINSMATAKAQSTADNAFSQAQAVGSQASAEIATQSEATLKAQNTADSAFKQAQSATDYTDKHVASQASAVSEVSKNASEASSQANSALDAANSANAEITNLKGGSTLTIAKLEDGLGTKVDNSDFSTYKTQTASQFAETVKEDDFKTYQTQTSKLIEAKVDNGTYQSDKTQTAKDISSKVSSSDFNTYKTQTADLIDDKVSNSAYASDKTQTASEIADRVSNSAFSTYQIQTASQIASKVDNGAFSTYKTQTADLIAQKVANSDFSAYQATTAKAIESKVESKDFNTYKTQTDSAISSKVESSNFQALQTQVNDSSVGTNLLENTADNGVGLVSIQGDNSIPAYSAPMTRNSSYIEMTNATGSELYYRFCNTDSSMHNLKPGQTYTIQGEVYVSKGAVRFRSQNEVNGGWTDYSGCASGDLATNTSGFVHVNYTFTVPSNATAFYLSWQVYNFDSTTVFRFRRMKLEIGSNATDYSTNPLDNATQSQITQLSGEIEQKVDSGDFSTYKTQTANLIGSKVDSGDFSTYQKQTADLISAKVSTKDFSAYQDTTAKAISSKVESGDFNTYKTQTAGLISSKVDNGDFSAYKTQTDKLIEAKVDNGTYQSDKTQTANDIASKVANKDFETYKTQTADLISSKVSTKDFNTYTSQTATAISSKVESSDFNTYKTQTTNLINDKVSSADYTSDKKQTADMISSKVDNGDFSTYKNQTANDINLKVSTKDLIDQINIQAGNTLISSSGQLTLSGKSVFLDSVDPVIMKSANIDTLLVGKKLTAADIAANTFTTNNGTFTVDKNGLVTATSLIIRGSTNLVYNASLSGGNGSYIPGWNMNGEGYYSNAVLYDGVPSLGWAGTTASGVWDNYATTYYQPVTQTGIPYSASGTFRDYGSHSGMMFQCTLAFFTDKATASRINGYKSFNYTATGRDSGSIYFTIDNVVAPSNAKYVALQFWAYNGKGHAAWSQPMLTQTAKATGYQPDTGNVVSAGTILGTNISASTINGTTFHGGDIINDANNASQFYPTTISSNGHIYTTMFNAADAMQTDLSTGSLTTKYRATNSSSNQYEAYDANISANQIVLSAGHTNGKDMSFSQSVTGSNQDGYVLISPLDGLTFKGDNQQITFSGTSADVTPKGIIITPYGNINPNGTQNIWYVGNGPTMKTASFGIDGSGANNIQFNRSLDIGNFNINTYHTITSSDSGPIHFNRANGKSGDIYAATVHYESLTKASLLSVKQDVQKADTAYWAQLVNSIDLATYQYKTDDNTSHLRLSSIVDDVNVTKQWQLPDVFVARDENGKLVGVDDSVLLNATLATVQEQQKEIDQLNGHNMELEARLNKLEAKLNG